MSAYMQSTLEIDAAGLPRFAEAMARIVPVLERQGWKLLGAYVQYTGRLNTVIDVWQIDDFNHYARGLQGLLADPGFPEVKKILDETILKETVVLAHAAPYFKPAV